jgi:hypothetical protein
LENSSMRGNAGRIDPEAGIAAQCSGRMRQRSFNGRLFLFHLFRAP